MKLYEQVGFADATSAPYYKSVTFADICNQKSIEGWSLVTLFWDGNFPIGLFCKEVGYGVFSEQTGLKDEAFERHLRDKTEKFLKEQL